MGKQYLFYIHHDISVFFAGEMLNSGIEYSIIGTNLQIKMTDILINSNFLNLDGISN